VSLSVSVIVSECHVSELSLSVSVIVSELSLSVSVIVSELSL